VTAHLSTVATTDDFGDARSDEQITQDMQRILENTTKHIDDGRMDNLSDSDDESLYDSEEEEADGEPASGGASGAASAHASDDEDEGAQPNGGTEQPE
jgi:hypothetical protein